MSMILPPGHPGIELQKALLQHLTTHPQQSEVVERIIAFMESTTACFERTHHAGHITGSAWLLTPARDKALLTLHRKLKRWMQPGGHADGDTNPLRVAIREAEEESGIYGITPISPQIYDVDVHQIPAQPGSEEPAHWHYDIRYLLQAPHEHFAISDESDDLAWWSAQDFIEKQALVDESIMRMARAFPKK